MIYLDFNATTPMLPDVEAVVSDSWKQFSNPSGSHRASAMAADLLDGARSEVALILSVNPLDVIFTAGSTEALTIAIWGQILGADSRRKKVLVSAIEHKAVLETAKLAARVTGKELVVIPALTDGAIDLDFLESNLSEDVALVAVMAANNETGVVQPYNSVSTMAEVFGIPYLCDSTQVIGKNENFVASELNAMLTISGHKIYGPKGVGALIMSQELQKSCISILPGGGQERGMRGGTSNLAGVTGMATALRVVTSESPNEMRRQEILRDLMYWELVHIFEDEMELNSRFDHRLKNTFNVRFKGASADAVLISLNHVMASRASACTAGTEEPSHVLLAMGRSVKAADESIRFSLGRTTTEEDIRLAIEDVSQAVTRVRTLSS